MLGICRFIIIAFIDCDVGHLTLVKAFNINRRDMRLVERPTQVEQDDLGARADIYKNISTCTGGYDRILSCKLNADSAIP